MMAVQSLYFNKGLPFNPRELLIYVENREHPDNNKFICDHYTDITNLLAEDRLKLQYLPFINQKIADYSLLRYYYPHLRPDSPEIHYERPLESKDILSYCADPINDKDIAGFLLFGEEIKGQLLFAYYPFEVRMGLDFFTELEEACYQLVELERHKKYGDIKDDDLESLCRISHIYFEKKVSDNADNDLGTETEILKKEIVERINQLRLIGIDEMAIRQLIEVEHIISPLLITADHRIFLPGYNNLEIKMSPLPKAVYFLFLSHPEGILFKRLPEYRDELMAWYRKISGRENPDDMWRSVEDATDPTKNAINEKCSRIREAFVQHFDQSLAENYFITGHWGSPKKIRLDRKLVDWN